ncbi:hypothetical protein C8R47DRAFT_1262453 [Mycena vitilis]|nr:hypothetical protein C8R47DRAFT_1262453 [Mycena vitilis]
MLSISPPVLIRSISGLLRYDPLSIPFHPVHVRSRQSHTLLSCGACENGRFLASGRIRFSGQCPIPVFAGRLVLSPAQHITDTALTSFQQFNKQSRTCFKVFNASVESQAADSMQLRLSVSSPLGHIKMYSVKERRLLVPMWSLSIGSDIPRDVSFLGANNQTVIIHTLRTGLLHPSSMCYDSETGQPTTRPEQLDGAVGFVTFSPDEQFKAVHNLSTDCYDLYSPVNSLIPVATSISPRGETRKIKAATFVEDGRTLGYSTRDYHFLASGESESPADIVIWAKPTAAKRAHDDRIEMEEQQRQAEVARVAQVQAIAAKEEAVRRATSDAQEAKFQRLSAMAHVIRILMASMVVAMVAVGLWLGRELSRRSLRRCPGGATSPDPSARRWRAGRRRPASRRRQGRGSSLETYIHDNGPLALLAFTILSLAARQAVREARFQGRPSDEGGIVDQARAPETQIFVVDVGLEVHRTIAFAFVRMRNFLAPVGANNGRITPFSESGGGAYADCMLRTFERGPRMQKAKQVQLGFEGVKTGLGTGEKGFWGDPEQRWIQTQAYYASDSLAQDPGSGSSDATLVNQQGQPAGGGQLFTPGLAAEGQFPMRQVGGRRSNYDDGWMGMLNNISTSLGPSLSLSLDLLINHRDEPRVAFSARAPFAQDPATGVPSLTLTLSPRMTPYPCTPPSLALPNSPPLTIAKTLAGSALTLRDATPFRNTPTPTSAWYTDAGHCLVPNAETGFVGWANKNNSCAFFGFCTTFVPYLLARGIVTSRFPSFPPPFHLLFLFIYFLQSTQADDLSIVGHSPAIQRKRGLHDGSVPRSEPEQDRVNPRTSNLTPPHARGIADDMSFVFGLSAKTAPALEELRAKYVDWLGDSSSAETRSSVLSSAFVSPRACAPAAAMCRSHSVMRRSLSFSSALTRAPSATGFLRKCLCRERSMYTRRMLGWMYWWARSLWGSIKALQMWADMPPPGGPDGHAREIADRLQLPESSRRAATAKVEAAPAPVVVAADPPATATTVGNSATSSAFWSPEMPSPHRGAERHPRVQPARRVVRHRRRPRRDRAAQEARRAGGERAARQGQSLVESPSTREPEKGDSVTIPRLRACLTALGCGVWYHI